MGYQAAASFEKGEAKKIGKRVRKETLAAGNHRAESCMYLAAAVLHAVTDLLLVNIQADVIHILHGGASFGVV